MEYIRESIKYLNSYKDLKQSIPLLKQEIENIDEEMQGIKAIDYSSESFGGGDSLPDDRVIELLYKKQIKEQAVTTTKKKLAHIEQIVNQLLSSNDEKIKLEGQVLQKHYIEGLSMGHLQSILIMSERQLYNIRQKALKRLAIYLYGINAL